MHKFVHLSSNHAFLHVVLHVMFLLYYFCTMLSVYGLHMYTDVQALH